MAYTFIGAVGGSTNNSTTITVAASTLGASPGDELLVGISQRLGSGGTIAAPDGTWTRLNGLQYNSGTDLGAAVFYKIAEASDLAGNLIFTLGGSNTKGSCGVIAVRAASGSLASIKGVSAQVNASAANIAIPAVTASGVTMRVVFAAKAHDAAHNAITTPAFTLRSSEASGGGAATTRTRSSTQTSTNTGTAALTVVSTTSAVSVGFQIALGEDPQLSGSSATTSWGIPAGTLTTEVSIAGASVPVSWTVPAGALTLGGATTSYRNWAPTVWADGVWAEGVWAITPDQLTLFGATGTTSWTIPSGELITKVTLSGTSASPEWIGSAAVLTTKVQVSGTSALTSWAAPADALATKINVSGVESTTSWSVPSSTLSLNLEVDRITRIGLTGPITFLAFEVEPPALEGTVPLGTWTVPAAGTLSKKVGLSGTSAVTSWALGSGTLLRQTWFSGLSASASWTIPSGAFSTEVVLSGTTATSAWSVPMGAFVAGLLFQGSAAAASWTIPSNTLSLGVTCVGDPGEASWGAVEGTWTFIRSLSGVEASTTWGIGEGSLVVFGQTDPAQPYLWPPAEGGAALSKRLHPKGPNS